jgi:hypothetical protein
MSYRSRFVLSLMVLVTVFASGQTSGNLAAKYPVVSAYQVRPRNPDDGQIYGRWTGLRNDVGAALHT